MCDDGEVVGPGEGLVGRHPVEDVIEAEALIGKAGVDQAHDQGRKHGFYWQAGIYYIFNCPYIVMCCLTLYRI